MEKIIALWEKLIYDFMRQSDVISGKAFDMPTWKPRSWYEAISSTGFCVKVSDVFKERMLDNNPLIMRQAKIMSITVDENKFGHCVDGSHNAWHTCIDTGYDYVIDLTIAQFGSKYSNKFIWKKVDWLNEFQNNNDQHNVEY